MAGPIFTRREGGLIPRATLNREATARELKAPRPTVETGSDERSSWKEIQADLGSVALRAGAYVEGFHDGHEVGVTEGMVLGANAVRGVVELSESLDQSDHSESGV